MFDKFFFQLSLVVNHASFLIVYDYESKACSFVSHIYLIVVDAPHIP
jgi:hypothetical protein